MYDLDEDNDNLTLTKAAVETWKMALKQSKLSDEFKQSLEWLIGACAKYEWGEHTYTTVNKVMVMAIIEHFDGRKRAI